MNEQGACGKCKHKIYVRQRECWLNGWDDDEIEYPGSGGVETKENPPLGACLKCRCVLCSIAYVTCAKEHDPAFAARSDTNCEGWEQRDAHPEEETDTEKRGENEMQDQEAINERNDRNRSLRSLAAEYGCAAENLDEAILNVDAARDAITMAEQEFVAAERHLLTAVIDHTRAKALLLERMTARDVLIAHSLHRQAERRASEANDPQSRTMNIKWSK